MILDKYSKINADVFVSFLFPTDTKPPLTPHQRAWSPRISTPRSLTLSMVLSPKKLAGTGLLLARLTSHGSDRRSFGRFDRGAADLHLIRALISSVSLPHANTARALYVRSYVRSYVSTYVSTFVRTFVRKYVRTYVSTYVSTFVRRYVRTYVSSFLCLSNEGGRLGPPMLGEEKRWALS